MKDQTISSPTITIRMENHMLRIIIIVTISMNENDHRFYFIYLILIINSKII